MRWEMHWDREADKRKKAKREGKEYKPPKVRKANREWRRRREKIHGFARERRKYENDPEAYIEEHSTTGVRTYRIDDGEEITGVWVPFEGPRGGQGWKHTGTGKKLYQLERPGTNTIPNEPPDIESKWREPTDLDDDFDLNPPLTASEASDYLFD